MKVGLESVIAMIDENVRMIIVHFVRRDMRRCVQLGGKFSIESLFIF